MTREGRYPTFIRVGGSNLAEIQTRYIPNELHIPSEYKKLLITDRTA